MHDAIVEVVTCLLRRRLPVTNEMVSFHLTVILLVKVHVFWSLDVSVCTGTQVIKGILTYL